MISEIEANTASYASQKADYWTRVSVRTGRAEHARAAEFWNRVANLRREPPTPVPVKADWAQALFFAGVLERFARACTKERVEHDTKTDP
jgi:hypothetical protein